jgi:hypothetical protein
MDSIPNLQPPLPVQDTSSIMLKGLSDLKQETDDLLALTQEASLTPPNLGTKVDLQA